MISTNVFIFPNETNLAASTVKPTMSPVFQHPASAFFEDRMAVREATAADRRGSSAAVAEKYTVWDAESTGQPWPNLL